MLTQKDTRQTLSLDVYMRFKVKLRHILRHFQRKQIGKRKNKYLEEIYQIKKDTKNINVRKKIDYDIEIIVNNIQILSINRTEQQSKKLKKKSN